MQLTIPLPDEGKCLLKIHQAVDFETPFIEVKKEVSKEIMLAEKLKIPPQKIFNYLKKFVGDTVVKDEIIAQKKSFFSESKYASQYQGLITEVDHERGKITLKIQDSQEIIKKCFFKGEVKEITKNAVLLTIKKKEEFSLKKNPDLLGGPVVYLEQLNNETATELDQNVLLIENISEINLSKIEVLGVKAVISPANLENNSNRMMPCLQLKNSQDFLKIKQLQFPYCITDTNSGKIIFYA